MRVGRIIAGSDGFETCVRDVIETGIPATPIGSPAHGPYTLITGDPVVAGEPVTRTIERALGDARNFSDISVYCDPLMKSYGCASSVDHGTGPQRMGIATFFLDDRVMAFPNAGRLEATDAEFFMDLPAAEWHEALHQNQWQDGPQQTTSMTYMVAECLVRVGVQSQACLAVCPGDLRPVSRYDAAGCDCRPDPRLVHAIFQRARQRYANPRELALSLDALTDAGDTLAELESSLRRPGLARTSGTMTINGVASEPAWQTAALHAVDTPVINTTGDTVYGSDLSATWRATYDETNVYFFVDVVDDVRAQDNSAATYHLDDSVEIYIDADGGRSTSYGANDFQLGFRPSDPATHYGHHSAKSPLQLNFVTSNHTLDEGYRVEVAVPWALLGVPPGGTLAVEVHVNDDDGAGRDVQLAWATNSPDAWHDPSLFTAVSLPVELVPQFPGGAITLNGVAAEPDWFRPVQSIERVPAPITDANGTGQWRAFWNDTHLYLFVEVTDEPALPNDGPNPWHDDSIEIYLDPDNSHRGAYDGNDYQFVFRRDDAGQVHLGGSSAPNKAGIEFGSANVASGYTFEVAIPWGTIGVNPADGTLIGLDIHINDDDNGGTREGKRSWHSTSDESWRDTRAFGAIRLVGEPEPAGLEFFYTASPPVIDGNVGTDDGWDAWQGPPGAIDNPVLNPGTVDATAIWRGVWDYENLYLHVDVNEPGQPVANSGTAWWNDDSVEVFLDPGFRHGQSYDGVSEFQYIFLPGQTTFIGSGSTQSSQGIEVASSEDGTGYSMEIKIPWSELGGHIGVGSAIGFDVHVNDDDGGGPDREGKLAWALSPLSGDVSWLSPLTFGRVTLAR